MRKLNIGFVLPCDFHNHQPFRNHPLTALFLLTILNQKFGEDVDVSIIDLRGVQKDNAIYYVPEKDIYLYSVATIDFPETVRIANIIKKK